MYSFSSYSPKINCLLLLNISGSDFTNKVSWSKSKGNNINNVKTISGVLENKELPYELRDHALFTAFAPYKQPRYALSVVIEHGGTGSSVAAPIAKKIIKKVIDRHQLRKKYQQDLFQEI